MITTVDLGAPPAETARAVAGALCDLGAFYLRGHGIADEVVAGAYRAGEALRRLEDEAKAPFEVGVNGLARGWHRVPASGPRRYETFEIGLETARSAPTSLDGALHGPNVWPDLPRFREQAYRYFEAVLDLSLRLLGPLAAGLRLPPGYLPGRAARPVTLLRMIDYEARQTGEDAVRIVPHSDFELLTVISETYPGFELCDRHGRWHQAATAGTAELLVLAGDVLEIVTGGRVESPLHRVRAGAEARQSMVFFFGLDAEATIAPQLPVAPGHDDLYGPTVVGHHLARQILSCPSLRARHVEGTLLPDLPLRGGNPYKAYKMPRLVDELPRSPG